MGCWRVHPCLALNKAKFDAIDPDVVRSVIGEHDPKFKTREQAEDAMFRLAHEVQELSGYAPEDKVEMIERYSNEHFAAIQECRSKFGLEVNQGYVAPHGTRWVIRVYSGDTLGYKLLSFPESPLFPRHYETRREAENAMFEYASPLKRGNTMNDVPLPPESTPEPSPEQHVFTSGAVRSTDCDHLRFDLISPIAMKELAKTCDEGARKYGDFNWEKGIPANNLISHAIGHLYEFLSGDRSEPHLGHAMWNVMAAIHSVTLWPELNAGTLRADGCKPPSSSYEEQMLLGSSLFIPKLTDEQKEAIFSKIDESRREST